jgi:hypothetical protein
MVMTKSSKTNNPNQYFFNDFLKQPEFVGLLCEARLLIFEEVDAFLRSLGGLQDPSASLQKEREKKSYMI